MNIVKKIKEDVMIHTFLKAEFNSSRFKDRLEKEMKILRCTSEVILSPDLESGSENEIRKDLLKAHRGFESNKDIFGGFPEYVEWHEVELSTEEVLNIKYTDFRYWNKHSDNTRSPKVAAINIKKNMESLEEDSRERFQGITRAIKSGASFADLILVAKNKDAYLVVLEGHLRLTGYALNPSHIPKPMRVIVGFSNEINQWSLY